MKIVKQKLVDLSLNEGEKDQVCSILSNKKHVKGFKYRIWGGLCVAIGKYSGNDFDIPKVASRIQSIRKKQKKAVPERFRFILLAA